MADQNLKVNITGDSSKLSNALSSASSKLSSFGSKMQSVGKSMSTRLTLPLVAAGAAATKMAFDFDKSMTSIQALVGVSADKVSEMGDAAKKMAIDTGKSANEAAEALFFITSAGLRGSDAMDVLNMSLKASAVGLGETKTIADLSTSAMNAYGKENLSASGATDILTAAVRLGKLEASELAGAMGGVIPIASSMGVSFDQVGGAMAAMSKTGTKAAEGATQLNAIMTSIAKPTQESELAFEKMGMSSSSLKDSLSEKGLMGTLVMLKEGLDATGQEFTDIAPNVRAWKGVLDLTGPSMQDNIELFDEMTKASGATDEAFKKTSQSASFKMTQGLNAMKSSLLSVGQVILTAIAPAVQKLGAFFTSLSEKFQALSPTTQKIIVAFAGIVAALGPVIAIIGTLLTMAPAIGAAFTLMMGPVGLVIAGLTAISVVIYKNWSGIKAALVKIGNYFIELYNNSLPIQLAVNLLIMQFKSFLAVGKFVFKTIVNVFKLFGQNVMTIFGSVADIIMGVFTFDKDKIMKGFTNLSTGLKSNLTKAFDDISTDAKALGGNIVDNFNEAIKSKKIAKIKVDAEVNTGGGDGESDGEMLDNHIANNEAIVQSDIQTAGRRKQVKAASVLEMQAIDTSDKEQQIVSTAEFNLSQDAVESQNFENKKIRFMGFMMSMTEAQQQMQAIGSAIDGSFGAIGSSITKMFGGAESATGAFVGTLAKDALNVVGSNLKIALSGASTAATQTAASFGPAAAFVLPALLAGATALISGSFAKFANGGIVSGPTMGLVGEYPGARSNPEVIAPLNKLQGMIGSSGGSQNINVGGQIRLEGQDLLIAIERANDTADRLF
jgi:TP901 family phage tail tape measure protein